MSRESCVCVTQENISEEVESIAIEGNILKIEYSAYSCDSSWFEDIRISYCPFCGRKLNTDKNG